MPVDWSRYPANWATEIRPAILARARYRCEWCGVGNGWIGHRDKAGAFRPCSTCATSTAPPDCVHGKAIRIVLTIAHVHDADPMNVDPANLAALCQRCHNRHDGPLRRGHAAETRRRRRLAAGQTELLS